MTIELLERLMENQIPRFFKGHTTNRFNPSLITRLESELDKLIKEARHEQFEVGMISRFASMLHRLYQRDPIAVSHLLEQRVRNDDCELETICEIMEWTRDLEPEKSREHIVSLLLVGLEHPVESVRDSASLALGHLEGAAAIPHLMKAVKRETNPGLRRYMTELLNSL